MTWETIFLMIQPILRYVFFSPGYYRAWRWSKTTTKCSETPIWYLWIELCHHDTSQNMGCSVKSVRVGLLQLDTCSEQTRSLWSPSVLFSSPVPLVDSSALNPVFSLSSLRLSCPVTSLIAGVLHPFCTSMILHHFVWDPCVVKPYQPYQVLNEEFTTHI